MAQIKKIVKPGDTVRGAKVGLAALDKDGLVKSFPIPANSTGKYLGIDVSNNPGWFAVPALPAYDHQTDVGEILYAGENGPYWGNAPGYIDDISEDLPYAPEFDAWVDQHINDITLRYQFLKVDELLYILSFSLKNISENDIELQQPVSVFVLPSNLIGKINCVSANPVGSTVDDGENDVSVYVNVRDGTSIQIRPLSGNDPFTLYAETGGMYFTTFFTKI